MLVFRILFYDALFDLDVNVFFNTEVRFIKLQLATKLFDIRMLNILAIAQNHIPYDNIVHMVRKF